MFFIHSPSPAQPTNMPRTSVLTRNNSWVTNDIQLTGKMITNEGIKNWSDKDAIIRTFFYADKVGLLDVVIRCKAVSGESKIQIKLDDFKEMVVECKDRNFHELKVGQYNITQSGYHFVELMGVQKSGLYYAEVTEVILDNQVAEGQLHFIGDPDNYFGRRGPSCHLAYSVPSGAGAIEWFYNEVTIPVHSDVVGSYFMATGFNGGYFGIQVNSSTERRVLFSIWSAFKTDDPTAIPADYKVTALKAGDDVVLQDFGNEGSGKQSFLRFYWQTGTTYKFLVRCVPTGNGETDYTAYFALENGEFRLISSLRKPKTSTNLTGLYSFLENFLPNAGCYTRMGEYGNQWVRDVGGKWHEMTTARFTQDATANKQVRLDCTGGVIQENKFCLKNCGFFSERIKAYTTLTRSGGGESPSVDLTTLP